ncbi:MAG: FAD-dependent oxidoreductase, partial [Acidimicrobiia bacterium]
MQGDQLVVDVVGAGPTGLTLAYLLARAGVSVSIFDAAPGPGRESSRATSVHAGTLEALDRFDGVGEE